MYLLLQAQTCSVVACLDRDKRDTTHTAVAVVSRREETGQIFSLGTQWLTGLRLGGPNAGAPGRDRQGTVPFPPSSPIISPFFSHISLLSLLVLNTRGLSAEPRGTL